MNITGHSLGGGLAAVVGSITGYPTTTFNAAGVHKNTLKDYGISDSQTQHIQAYNGEKDPLNTVQDNRGTILSVVALAGISTGNMAVTTTAGSAYVNGVLPKAIGERKIVPTSDNFVTGHSTDGIRETLVNTRDEK